MKISELDAKILRIMLYDGRMSFTEIAQMCNTTKSQIWKRYNTMQKQGVISGATVQVHFERLGYDALVNLLISVEPNQVEQVMEYIGRITEIRACRQYNSIYNIRAVAVLKNLNELDHVKAAIRRHLQITALKTYIWTGVKNIPENLQITPIQKIHEFTSDTQVAALSDQNKINDLDLKIIEKLTINGRASFTSIAKEMHTSTDTILKRYKKLKINGIIKVSIQIDPNKLGYSSILDFNIASASSVNESEITRLLSSIPDIIIITKTSGDYDLQITAMIRDIKQMFTLQEQIARIGGITKIETSARKIPDKWPTPRQYITTL